MASGVAEVPGAGIFLTLVVINNAIVHRLLGASGFGASFFGHHHEACALDCFGR
jgi:hypothetical protein